MTDTLLEENVHNLYSKIDSLFPGVYIPSYYDYETDDTMEDVDGNEMTLTKCQGYIYVIYSSTSNSA